MTTAGMISYAPTSAILAPTTAGIAVDLNNMLDRRPRPAPRAFPDNSADVSTNSPIHRLWYVQLMGRF